MKRTNLLIVALVALTLFFVTGCTRTPGAMSANIGGVTEITNVVYYIGNDAIALAARSPGRMPQPVPDPQTGELASTDPPIYCTVDGEPRTPTGMAGISIPGHALQWCNVSINYATSPRDFHAEPTTDLNLNKNK